MRLGLYTVQLKDGDLTHFLLLNYTYDGILEIQQRERFVTTINQMQDFFFSRKSLIFSDFE